MILAEVPAAAPALVDMLGPLIQLCALLVALASIALLAWAVRALLNGIASWLSFLPGVGGVAAGAVTSVERAISGAFGHAISGIEAAIGHQWHNLSRVLGMLWAEQKLVATNLWHLAQEFYHAVPLSDLTRIIHRLDGRIAHITRTITRDITHSVHTTITRVEHLGHAVIPRLGRLEHAIDHTIPREIKSTRALAKEAERGVKALWDRVRGLPTTADITAAVATAVAALGLAGLDLLKCAESGSLFSKRGCGMWSLLDDVLGLLADAVILADLCQALPLLEEGFAAVEGPLTALIAGAATAICAQPPSGWATFAVEPAALPPAQTLGAIP